VEGHLVVKEPVLVTPAAGLEGEEQLYAEARHKNVKGRSQMSKAQLEHAVDR